MKKQTKAKFLFSIAMLIIAWAAKIDPETTKAELINFAKNINIRAGK